MENNKPPKIFVTDGYKVEHKKFVDKLILNSILPVTSAPYIFHDPVVAERITQEGMMIQNCVIKSIADNLILVSADREHFLHHTIPTVLPNWALLHDVLEDQIGDYPKFTDKIITKKIK